MQYTADLYAHIADRVETAHGAVSRNVNSVWIEYRPEAGIPLKTAVLTKGYKPSKSFQPVSGPQHVVFAEKYKGQPIRIGLTEGRQGLAELVAIAKRINAEINAATSAVEAAQDAARKAKIAAAIDAAAIPAGHVRIDEVDHDAGAADGWGSTDYRHAGYDLTDDQLDKMDRRDVRADGVLIVYVDGAKLDALIAHKRAAKADRDAAKAAKAEAGRAEAAELLAEAVRTGKPVAVGRTTEECDGSACDCSLDVVVTYVHPDGSHTYKRTHSH
jgi:hypothetical protein